jgi:hypothetical protein
VGPQMALFISLRPISVPTCAPRPGAGRRLRLPSTMNPRIRPGQRTVNLVAPTAAELTSSGFSPLTQSSESLPLMRRFRRS